MEEALADNARIDFEGEGVDGSIRLAGARIDDVSLHDYYLTVEKQQEVRLFRPENSEYGYFATYYWLRAARWLPDAIPMDPDFG